MFETAANNGPIEGIDPENPWDITPETVRHQAELEGSTPPAADPWATLHNGAFTAETTHHDLSWPPAPPSELPEAIRATVPTSDHNEAPTVPEAFLDTDADAVAGSSSRSPLVLIGALAAGAAAIGTGLIVLLG